MGCLIPAFTLQQYQNQHERNVHPGGWEATRLGLTVQQELCLHQQPGEPPEHPETWLPTATPPRVSCMGPAGCRSCPATWQEVCWELTKPWKCHKKLRNNIGFVSRTAPPASPHGRQHGKSRAGIWFPWLDGQLASLKPAWINASPVSSDGKGFPQQKQPNEKSSTAVCTQRMPVISISACVCAVSTKPWQLPRIKLEVGKKIHLKSSICCIFLMMAIKKSKHN